MEREKPFIRLHIRPESQRINGTLCSQLTKEEEVSMERRVTSKVFPEREGHKRSWELRSWGYISLSFSRKLTVRMERDPVCTGLSCQGWEEAL